MLRIYDSRELWNSQDDILEWRESQEICRGSPLSFQQSIDEYIHMKKLPEAGERATEKG